MASSTRVGCLTGAAIVGGIVAVHYVGQAAFPYTNPRAREIRRLFAYAHRQVGDLLDGVSMRFVGDLELVTVVDTQRRSRGQKVFEGYPSGTSVRSYVETVSRTTGLPERNLRVEILGLGGVYTPATREIWLNIADGPRLEAGGEEIAHAALNVPHRLIQPDQALVERSLDEAFAGALGQVELVSDFLLKEEHQPADEVARKKAAIEEEFWRESEADPKPGLFSPSTVALQPYHHSVVVRTIVERVIKANVPLREKFIRARQEILLHTMTVE